MLMERQRFHVEENIMYSDQVTRTRISLRLAADMVKFGTERSKGYWIQVDSVSKPPFPSIYFHASPDCFPFSFPVREPVQLKPLPTEWASRPPFHCKYSDTIGSSCLEESVVQIQGNTPPCHYYS